MTYPIIIPLHHGGGKLGDDTELRFALRSLEQHFKDPFKIVIVGKKLPIWLEGVEHIIAKKGLKSALVAAAAAYPEGFFWCYDDCCLLHDMDADGMRQTPAQTGWSSPETSWSRELESIRHRLENGGYRAWDYSRPHGPYWFDKSMVDESFVDWPGMSGKFPWESWILSKRDWPRRHGAVKQYYGAYKSPPEDGAIYLNYNDEGNTARLRDWLAERFPVPSRFEKPLGSIGKFWFIHVPKTAGKSIIHAAGRACLNGGHRPWRMQKREWERAGSPPVVACVRHPVDRAVSAYNYFLTRDWPEEDSAHRVLRELAKRVSLSEFWEEVDIPFIQPSIRHLQPQSSWIETAPVSILLRYETLHRDFKNLAEMIGVPTVLPVLNESKKFDCMLTAKADARIREIYERDFKLYYPNL